MRYHELVAAAQERLGGVTQEAALRAIRASLETLAERVERSEMLQLAAQLPAELGDIVRNSTAATERFDVDELFRRVGEREGVAPGVAARHVGVVLQLLLEAVSPGEREDLEAQLPADLERHVDSTNPS